MSEDGKDGAVGKGEGPAGEGRALPLQPHLDLENYVPALITFLANKISYGASLTYRELFGLGVNDWRCLSQLAIEPWISPNRICQVIGLDKAAVSRSIRVLEEKALVEVRSSRERSRFHEVALTEAGAALHDRILTVALERERRLTADLDPDERTVLLRALNKMHARISVVNGPIDLDGL